MTVFDLESSPLSEEEIMAVLPKFDQSDVRLGNRKNPHVIMEFMASQEEEYYAKALENAALDPRTSRVLCIGYMEVDGEPQVAVGEEKHLVTDFWERWTKHDQHWVGFNIHNFDLPFLVRRSWLLDIRVPDHVIDGRYWDESFIDLMAIWGFGRREDTISLAAMAKFLGCGEKSGSGKDFADLWQTDRAKAIEYVRNDLRLTAACARKMLIL